MGRKAKPPAYKKADAKHDGAPIDPKQQQRGDQGQGHGPLQHVGELASEHDAVAIRLRQIILPAHIYEQPGQNLEIEGDRGIVGA
jgi:hypothetical protein